MKKRSQNHFCLLGILFLKYHMRFIWYTRHFKNCCMRYSRTTENNNWQSDHVRKRSWQTIKTRNTNSKDNNFYSWRQVLRVKCLWKSWVTNKTLQILALSFKPPSPCLLFAIFLFYFLFTNNRIPKLFFRTLLF